MELDFTEELRYLGRKIRQKREDSCMSQEELAEAMGISVSTLYRFENGVRAITVDSLFCITDVLDAPISDLLPPRFWKENCHRRKRQMESQENKLKCDLERLSSRDKKIVYDTMLSLVGSMLNG